MFSQVWQGRSVTKHATGRIREMSAIRALPAEAGAPGGTPASAGRALPTSHAWAPRSFPRHSTPLRLDAQHFPRFAFRPHFKRTAANLAIGRESLRGHARVDDQLERLATERTLDRFRNLHGRNIAAMKRRIKLIQ